MAEIAVDAIMAVADIERKDVNFEVRYYNAYLTNFYLDVMIYKLYNLSIP
jgi:hypothetical protein